MKKSPVRAPLEQASRMSSVEELEIVALDSRSKRR